MLFRCSVQYSLGVVEIISRSLVRLAQIQGGARDSHVTDDQPRRGRGRCDVLHLEKSFQSSLIVAPAVVFGCDGYRVQARHGTQRRLPRNKNRQKSPKARPVWPSDYAGRCCRHVYGLLRHIQDELTKKVLPGYPVSGDIIRTV